MKVNRGAVLFAVLTLIVFTVLPLTIPQLIPSEIFTAISMQGFDLIGLLNKIALLGLAMATLTLLKGIAEKSSTTYLALSIASKIFWLLITLFSLGVGRIETFGLAVLSSEAGGVSNTVIFDLRLIAFFATIVVLLKIAHSILEFQMAPHLVQT